MSAATSTPPPAPPRSRWWRWVCAAAGVAFLAWFARGVDWTQTRDLLARLGWLAPLVFLPYAVVYVADTAGWAFCLGRSALLPFGRLLRIRWAGEGVNSVIPSAYIGGEAVKVLLLRGWGFPGAEAAAAAVLSKTLQTVAQVLFIALAAAAALTLGTASAEFSRLMGWIVAGGVVFLIGWFALLRRGIFATLHAVVCRLGLGRAAWVSRLERLRTLDARIQGFHRRRPGAFYASLAAYFAGWLLDTLELYVFASLLGMPLDWRQALVVEAFTGVVKGMAVFIPGAIGVQESAILFLGRMAGIPAPLALAYALVRRVRELLYAAIGWKLLVLEQQLLPPATRAAAQPTVHPT